MTNWAGYRREWMMQKRAEWKALGLCTQCGKKPARDGRVRCEGCSAQHAGRNAVRKAQGLCSCGAKPAPNRKHCLVCLEKHNQRSKLRWADPSRRAKITEANQRLRLECLNAYGGPICVCCGETELVFLTLDHIANDGAEHRRKIGLRSGAGLYRYLIRNNFPPGLQVLCWNCNEAKRIQGSCPHTRRLRAVS